jgi:uroporphyrin-III C-methyltransferase
MITGKVYLVGAGPGDPELLTLKAARLLRTADAVLHDDLVTPAILGLANPAAQLHNVGKRCGTKTISQEEINFLMVGLASAGLQVVRLKGGDPLIFGRAGEEIEALRRAGIPYEVVPGVTAALGAAAWAGIPLTNRRGPAAVVFVTGHRAANNEQGQWREFVRSGATLVIYMPGRNFGEIARRLRKAGLAGQTPCALVSRATNADQQLHVTTVGELPAAPQLAAPALLIVGEVIRLAAGEGHSFKLTPAMEQVLLHATEINEPLQL